MRYNRSAPPCPVIPALIYPDPGAAAEWLSQAFGFNMRLRIANHRIQMRAGEGCFTIAEGDIDLAETVADCLGKTSSHDFMNSNRSLLIISACVAGIPCANASWLG